MSKLFTYRKSCSAALLRQKMDLAPCSVTFVLMSLEFSHEERPSTRMCNRSVTNYGAELTVRLNRKPLLNKRVVSFSGSYQDKFQESKGHLKGI